MTTLIVFGVGFTNKSLEESSSEFKPITRTGPSQARIVCVEEETEHGLCSLSKPHKNSMMFGSGDGDTTLDVPLPHYARVTLLEHNERCEQGRCHLETQAVIPESLRHRVKMICKNASIIGVYNHPPQDS
ncbi:hypothetical protein TNCV_2660991 [Trichonephila clavipes]|nr:hypothetical protein TNCV_2660991 [Trichonephila clavipes]